MHAALRPLLAGTALVAVLLAFTVTAAVLTSQAIEHGVHAATEMIAPTPMPPTDPQPEGAQ